MLVPFAAGLLVALGWLVAQRLLRVQSYNLLLHKFEQIGRPSTQKWQSICPAVKPPHRLKVEINPLTFTRLEFANLAHQVPEDFLIVLEMLSE